MGVPRQENWSGWPFPSPVHAHMLSHFSRVQLCATLWTAAHQAPPSLGFSRQENWSGLPCPSPMHTCMLSRFSHVRLFATLWTIACQAPLSMGLSRQEDWRGLPRPSPGDLPNSGMEPRYVLVDFSHHYEMIQHSLHLQLPTSGLFLPSVS